MKKIRYDDSSDKVTSNLRNLTNDDDDDKENKKELNLVEQHCTQLFLSTEYYSSSRDTHCSKLISILQNLKYFFNEK